MRTQYEITAYHEAGHAVMAMSCRFSVTGISIKPNDDSLGHTAYNIPLEISDEVRRKVVLVNCGGLAADFIHAAKAGVGDDEVFNGHFGDQSAARDHLCVLSESDQFDLYLSMTIQYLKAPARWRVAEEIVYFLLGAGTINGSVLLGRWSQACPPITDADFTHLSACVATARRHNL